jgi:hypothetical protein
MKKNCNVLENKSALDASQKLYIMPRPTYTGTNSLFNSSTITLPGTNPQLIEVEESPTGINTFAIFSDGTLAGTSAWLNQTQKTIPLTWASATKNYYLIRLAAGSSTLYGGYEWFMGTDTEGAVVDSSGNMTELADPDYTGVNDKTNPVAMDGFVFQGQSRTCKIYNSNQNDPVTWAATSVIEANLIPGRIMHIRKVRNYLVVFKTHSIEFFKNAGNPTPGSPLEAIPEMALRYGCCGHNVVTDCTDGVIFIGADATGGSGVFKLDITSFTVTKISDPFVDVAVRTSYSTPASQLDVFGASALVQVTMSGRAEMSVLSIVGKELLLFPVNVFGTTATLVYDIPLKMWMVWTIIRSATEQAFPFKIMHLANTLYGYSPQLGPYPRVIGEVASGDFTGTDAGGVQAGTNYDVKWISSPMDFGTGRRKFMASLEVYYDVAPGDGGDSTISMYYFDGDSATGTTSRSITVATDGANRAIFRRLGSFRTRRFTIVWTGKDRIRLSVIEVDLMAAEDGID